MTQQNMLQYQLLAAEGATHIGLLVLVYDAIARDLTRAAEACHRNDVEQRCACSNHALSLIGHVETWLKLLDDEHLIESLRAFYIMLRERVLALQCTAEPAQFRELAQLVSGVRSTWQAKEQTGRHKQEGPSPKNEGHPAEGGSRQRMRLSFVA